MISLAEQFKEIPEGDRAWCVRLARSALNQVLIETLNGGATPAEKVSNNLKASGLARAIEILGTEFPEADDQRPVRKQTVYKAQYNNQNNA